jgi:hypothetical protein
MVMEELTKLGLFIGAGLICLVILAGFVGGMSIGTIQ